jgi:hypothetical protein
VGAMTETLRCDPAVTCQWDVPALDVQEFAGGGCSLCVSPGGTSVLICSERCGGCPCSAVSRFAVGRSDGDTSFGWDGRHESCEEHLAQVVASMINGDETVHAIVTIRWDTR